MHRTMFEGRVCITCMIPGIALAKGTPSVTPLIILSQSGEKSKRSRVSAHFANACIQLAISPFHCSSTLQYSVTISTVTATKTFRRCTKSLRSPHSRSLSHIFCTRLLISGSRRSTDDLEKNRLIALRRALWASCISDPNTAAVSHIR